MKRSILAVAVAATLSIASVSASAATLLDFTIDESSVPGNGGFGTTHVADKITGNYNERISFDGLGGFASKIYWDAGQFVTNDGATPVGTLLTSVPAAFPFQYSMYALMSATGTVTPNGIGGFNFTGGTASLAWYIDPNSDSTKALPATAGGSVAVGNTADDYLIASTSTLNTGEGHIFGGLANGDFEIIFDALTLTTGDQNAATPGVQNGDMFFTQPRPFYMMMSAAGQLNTFTPTGDQAINGSADITFIPEPGVLGLMGLGLLGMGAAARRRRAV